MNSFSQKGAICVPQPNFAPIKGLQLPFDVNTEVFCTHSSGSGSHSGKDAYFALDLANRYDEPAAVIHASADGVAYVFYGEDGNLCPEPAGSPAKAKGSICGDSWGNHIKILHQDGYYSFYVHLDHALVKTGDKIHRGEAIGVEGWTGMAGHRHLHWSVQKLPGSTAAEWLREIAWTGESVPFHFTATQNGERKTFDVAKIQCAHTGVGNAPPEQQPSFKGVR